MLNNLTRESAEAHRNKKSLIIKQEVEKVVTHKQSSASFLLLILNFYVRSFYFYPRKKSR